MRLSFIVVVLLILGALFIVREQQTDFKSSQSMTLFTKVYLKWLWKVGGNLKEIIVFSSHLDWIPETASTSTQPPATGSAGNTTNITIK